MQSLGGSHTFNGGYLFALSFYSQYQAGSDDPTIHQDGASTAVAVVTTFLGAGHAEYVPQTLQQALAGFTQKVNWVTVYGS
jgi:hypothetical protein